MINIKNLTIRFPRSSKNAVSDLDMVIQENRIFGLMGESGSGKTVTALSIMGLLKLKFPTVSIEGHIEYRDLDLIHSPEHLLKKIRGSKISMVFQNPFTYFDPSYKIKDQFMEILDHSPRDKINKILKAVQIRDKKRILSSYPHQLSGGQLQRLMIGLALLKGPEILIADEPTTALDPTLKSGILNLLKKLKDQEGITLLIISHDVSSVSKICDWIFILYRGFLVESSSAQNIISRPLHPYTQFLLLKNSIKSNHFLNNTALESSCPYYHLCPKSKDICSIHTPPWFTFEDNHVRCWLYGENHG